MKKHLRLLSIILVGLLSILINGCDQGMDTIVDTVMDPPPSTGPVAPPMQSAMPTPSYTFHGFLDHQETIHAIAFSS